VKAPKLDKMMIEQGKHPDLFKVQPTDGVIKCRLKVSIDLERARLRTSETAG
jgi:hypothetical protein